MADPWERNRPARPRVPPPVGLAARTCGTDRMRKLSRRPNEERAAGRYPIVSDEVRRAFTRLDEGLRQIGLVQEQRPAVVRLTRGRR
jgi:hypothetical protein